MKTEIEQRADNGWREWIVIELKDDHVSISSDYQKPDSNERRTWYDEGITFPLKDLSEVITALHQFKEETNL